MVALILKRILVFVLISGAVYLGLALALILAGRPGKKARHPPAPSFKELFIDYSDLPPLRTFEALDGAPLDYRLYPADSDKTLVLLHGSGWHSRYFLPLARAVAASGAARVYTPDLRGHGRSPARRGDIDYPDQLVDDLADLLALIHRKHPKTSVIISGHSSGGGLALRFAGSEYGGRAQGYALLAPFLKYNAPTTRPGSGGWARPYTPRLIGLTMLNNIGLTWFDHLPVIDFNMPEEARDGTETLVYSHRLNTGYAPRDYRKDLRRMTQPLLVVAGQEDQSFFADKYEPTISPLKEARFVLLPGVGHLDLVIAPETGQVLMDWLRGLNGQGRGRTRERTRPAAAQQTLKT